VNTIKNHFLICSLLLFVCIVVIAGDPHGVSGADRDASQIEVIRHEWSVADEWMYIGKTKYFWKVKVHNHSDIRKRIFAYYYLLDDEDSPLARNVASRYVEPQQSAEIIAHSYIMTPYVADVKRSRVKIKVGFPN
jgi:hypothetical protein